MPQWILITATVVLFSSFGSSATYAESKVFSGVSISIILDIMILVFFFN